MALPRIGDTKQKLQRIAEGLAVTDKDRAFAHALLLILNDIPSLYKAIAETRNAVTGR